RALTVQEVEAYIAERLFTAGFRDGGRNPFPAPILEYICKVTRGTPRLINLLCDSCLMIGFKAQRQIMDKNMVDTATAELGMNEEVIAVEAQEKLSASARGAIGRDFTSDAVVFSAVDILIRALKRHDAPISVVRENHAISNLKKIPTEHQDVP